MVSFAERQLLIRELAKRNLYEFIKYKFEYYYATPFLDNWHYEYLSEALMELLKGNITNLMIGMPPSYGKTELVARTFIPYALGLYPNMKFIYSSYGDELSKSVSVETRNFFKSKAYEGLFGKQKLIMDKSDHWFNEKGGGLFATTVGGAITGKHCHIGIADDLLKASEAYSEASRKSSIIYFTESFLSRLLSYAGNAGRIIVIMQRLHKNDLCGYLQAVASTQWTQINLQAINRSKQIYSIGNFTYTREEKQALFPARHTLTDLDIIKQTMGDYGFNAQYQQCPESAVGGFFDMKYFDQNIINDFDIPIQKLYIFIDPAESTKDSSDNRAIVCVGISQDSYNELPLIVIMDCMYGKWDNEIFIQQSFAMMARYPDAEVRIEPKGGGITLEQSLNKQILIVNLKRRNNGESILKNLITTFKVPKLSKHEKIATLLPAWNQGRLRYRRNALGIEQIAKELGSYNPNRNTNDDNCIDALSGITWQSDIYPYIKTQNQTQIKNTYKYTYYGPKWRI